MKRLKHMALLVILMIVATTSWSQDWKRTQNWYFGDSAGISFATDPPTVLTNGAMSALEGCATMSDTNGNLLFYTNGVTVWNKSHQVMDNGTGLNGHLSSTQASLIVPWPGNDSLYYIFTTDAVGQWKGLQHSLVNMNENGGLGKVTVKNVLLHTPVCEKLTATYHQNGKDIWLLSHEFSSNKYLVYLINKNGISACPYHIAVGNKFGTNISDITATQGAMKFSLDGQYIVSCLWSNQFFELSKFNKSTGEIYEPITISFFYPFYAEFSPNGKYLYVIDRGKNLSQFSLVDYNQDSILNSKRVIQSYNNERIDALQVSSNGKIYANLHDSLFLWKVDNPNSSADSIIFTADSLIFLAKKSRYGLPNFISSYFYRPTLDFQYITHCKNDTIRFQARSEVMISPSWKVIRNSSLVHSSNQMSFDYCFNDTGEYLVQLVSGTDTVAKIIHIEPKLELGDDTVPCNQNALEINIPDNFRCLNWQDGSDSADYTITENGIYYVSAYNISGCLVSDTIRVKFGSIQQPIINRSGDSLYTDTGSYSYQWFHNNIAIGNDNPFLLAKQTGNYMVQITDSLGCTSISNTFGVTVLSTAEGHSQYIRVFPNPSEAGNEVTIEGEELIQNIKVYDLVGKRVYEQDNINAFQHHLKIPKRGTYILLINGSIDYKIMIE